MESTGLLLSMKGRSSRPILKYLLVRRVSGFRLVWNPIPKAADSDIALNDHRGLVPSIQKPITDGRLKSGIWQSEHLRFPWGLYLSRPMFVLGIYLIAFRCRQHLLKDCGDDFGSVCEVLKI